MIDKTYFQHMCSLDSNPGLQGGSPAALNPFNKDTKSEPLPDKGKMYFPRLGVIKTATNAKT